VIVLGHIAGIPVEEWLLPWLSAGAAIVGLRASFGSRARRFGRAADPRSEQQHVNVGHDHGKGNHP
jgi:hypothetical protein